MSMHRSFAAALWLLVAAGAYGVAGAAWAEGAHTSELHPWVLIAVFWGAALVSVAIHHLSLYLTHASEALKRHWLDHAAQRTHLGARARLYLAQLSMAPRRLLRHADGQRLLVGLRSLPALARAVVRHAWSQHREEARRAPGLLIGWSRSARKALRA